MRAKICIVCGAEYGKPHRVGYPRYDYDHPSARPVTTRNGEVIDPFKAICMETELEQLHTENAKLRKRCLMAESGASNAISRLNKAISHNEADNMALAEKVLEAVYKTGWCSSNIYDDDVLDLTAIVRGEGEEE